MKNFLICAKHKVFTCEHPKNNFTELSSERYNIFSVVYE